MTKNFKIGVSLAISLVIVVVFGFILFQNIKDANRVNYKMGVITDIHAGNEKNRIIDGNIINYPREYKKLFTTTLKEMKNNGVDFVISTGDNTNNGKNQYADTLVRIAKEEKMEIIWVKGNHDREATNVMKNFNVKDKYYYYVEKGRWRIVVLDSSEINPAGIGGMLPEQMNWLKETLKTDKNIIIAMHHPVYNEFDLEKAHDAYGEFQKLIEDSGNVKYVFSGHYHTVDFSKKVNGIKYEITKALTLEKEVPNYKIINLQNE
jgi:3',5'-cyclic AMP phosphodiesterase CpdA